MKLTVLVDNNTFIDEYYYGEPGLSYYIEDGDTKILWDTGYSDVFYDNAIKLNIDLSKVDKIVLSHGHDDHTGGLKKALDAIDHKELIASTHIFDKKIDEGQEIGIKIDKSYIEKKMKVTLTDKPVKISDNIIFLGPIKEGFDFEKRYAIGEVERNGKMVPDEMIEDSALCYKSDKGLFIITGCSHSGICNIIEYAKEVCEDNRIYGVIGGFHLLKVDDRLEKTIEYLKNNKIELLYPCHCVALRDKIEMGKTLKIHEVGVGLKLEI